MIDARPPLYEAAALAIEAWGALGSCRPVSMAGAGPIPFTAVLAWCAHNQCDEDTTDMLIHVIEQLDADRAERMQSQADLQGAP